MVWSLWPLLFLLDLNQDWKKEKNKSCWSQVVTMPVYFGCVLRGFVPNWSWKTQTPSFCSHTESSCHKDHLAPKIRDESNPQWLRLAQLLDPHAPPTVRVPLSVTAGVSPSRLLLAAEPGMVFVGGKILELWKLGFRRGNLYRNRDGFLLGNWGIPILQSNQLQTGKFWFPSSQRSREGGFGFQPLDSITWLWLKIFSSQWLDDWETWVVPKTSALTNFDAIGILFITGVYKSTIKFWKTRDANGTGQLSSLVVCRWHLQPPWVECRGSKTIAHVWKWKSLTN